MKKLLHNKKGIELAVNYIVMMVLGLATLSLGFVIIKTFVVGGDQTITLTSDQLNSKVADLLCGPTDILCFNDNNQKIHRNEYAFVGLHVKNIYNNQLDTNVQIDMSGIKVYDPDGNPANYDSKVRIVPIGSTPLSIPAKQTGKLGFGIYADKDATKGTYSFLVTVTESATGTPTGFGTRKDRIIVEII